MAAKINKVRAYTASLALESQAQLRLSMLSPPQTNASVLSSSFTFILPLIRTARYQVRVRKQHVPLLGIHRLVPLHGVHFDLIHHLDPALFLPVQLGLLGPSGQPGRPVRDARHRRPPARRPLLALRRGLDRPGQLDQLDGGRDGFGLDPPNPVLLRVRPISPPLYPRHSVDRASTRSRTLFWRAVLPYPAPPGGASPSLSGPQTSRTKVTAGQTFTAVLGHDHHRGTADHAVLVVAPISDPVPLTFGSPGETHSWEFTLTLPSEIRLDESSLFTDILGRRAPRDLSDLVRSPPPTFRESRDASVEWICEATLRLTDPPAVDENGYTILGGVGGGGPGGVGSGALAPSFGNYTRERRGAGGRSMARTAPTGGPETDAIEQSSEPARPPVISGPPSLGGQYSDGHSLAETSTIRSIVSTTTTNTFVEGPMVDDRGFKLSRPPYLFVARAVFPFMPSDRHILEKRVLSNTGADEGFGSCLLAKHETGGATLSTRFLRATGSDAGVPAASRELVQVWKKRVPVFFGSMGPRTGTLLSRLQLSTLSTVIPRSTASIPMTLQLAFSSLLRFPGKSKVGIDRICVVLSCRCMTRGGAEPKPHQSLKEVRRQNFVLPKGRNVVPEADTSSDIDSDTDHDADAGLIGKPRSLMVKLDFALQGRGEEGKSLPCESLPPSFRTPNIENEVRSHPIPT